jgi:hypothetical protein
VDEKFKIGLEIEGDSRSAVKSVDDLEDTLDRLQKELDQTRKGMVKVDKEAKKSPKSMKDMAGGLKQVAVGLGLVMAAHKGMQSALSQVGGAIEYKAMLQDMATQLKTVTGSSQEAEKALEWAKTFSFRTPYELQDINEALIRLETYGMNAEEWMQTVGDTAAAMGKPIMMAVEAVADAGVGEFERLKEFGMKVVQEGGKDILLYTDKAGEQQKKIIDRNNKAMVESTIKTIWNERYKGGMEELSKNWNATMSNLQTSWLNARDVLFDEEWFDWVKGRMDELSDMLSGFAVSIEIDKEPIRAIDLELREMEKTEERLAKLQDLSDNKWYERSHHTKEDLIEIQRLKEEVVKNDERRVELLEKRAALLKAEKEQIIKEAKSPKPPPPSGPTPSTTPSGKKEDEPWLWTGPASPGEDYAAHIKEYYQGLQEDKAAFMEEYQFLYETEREVNREHYAQLQEIRDADLLSEQEYTDIKTMLASERRDALVMELSAYTQAATSIGKLVGMKNADIAKAEIPLEVAKAWQDLAEAKDRALMYDYSGAALAVAGAAAHFDAVKKLARAGKGGSGGGGGGGSRGGGGGRAEPSLQEADISRDRFMRFKIEGLEGVRPDYFYTGKQLINLVNAMERGFSEGSIQNPYET